MDSSLSSRVKRDARGRLIIDGEIKDDEPKFKIGEDSNTLRLTDRRYVRSRFMNLFDGNGSQVNSITNDRIWKNPQSFGFGCDNYQWNDEVCGYTTWDGGRDIQKELVNVAPTGVPLVSRFALTIRACDMILGSNYNGHNSDGALRTFVSLVEGNIDRSPSSENIKDAWDAFYPGITPPDEVINSLSSVVTEAGGSPKDGWKFLTYTLCISPDWHLL
jgi:hypothetical protein